MREKKEEQEGLVKNPSLLCFFLASSPKKEAEEEAKQSKAKQSKAKQSRAGQGRAGQGKLSNKKQRSLSSKAQLLEKKRRVSS